MRLLPLVPALLLALTGCGLNGTTPGASPTGEQARLTTLEEACPDIADAILGTSPTSAEQVRSLADTMDSIAASGGVKVKDALGSFPDDLRTLAGNLGSADLATKYAADVAGVARACAENGSPFPTA